MPIVNKSDSRGFRITRVYAVQPDDAIYKADEVMVHFADEQSKAQGQRKSIPPVSAASAEVNALVQGLACREIYDRQLAYGLKLALDGDIDDAKKIVAAAKAFVLGKRAARGRFQYLKWSFGTTATLIGLLCSASWYFPFQEVEFQRQRPDLADGAGHRFCWRLLERLVPDLLEQKNPQSNGGSMVTGAACPTG